MIYFTVQGGLCNRLRGIASAHEFAYRTGHDLTIIWPNNHECNCNLLDVFRLNCIVETNVISISYWQNFFLRNRRERLIKMYYMKKCDYILIDDDVYSDMNTLIQEGVAAKNIYITSAAYWLDSENAMEIFCPVPELMERINKLFESDEQYIVGVHLRRTDHQTSVEVSTTECCIRMMEEELYKNPNVKFYVASDDIYEKCLLKQRFQERIIMQENMSFSRECDDGIRAAVVDLYALAHCDLIFASKDSSFSGIAARIGNTPMVVIE